MANHVMAAIVRRAANEQRGFLTSVVVHPLKDLHIRIADWLVVIVRDGPFDACVLGQAKRDLLRIESCPDRDADKVIAMLMVIQKGPSTERL